MTKEWQAILGLWIWARALLWFYYVDMANDAIYLAHSPAQVQ